MAATGRCIWKKPGPPPRSEAPLSRVMGVGYPYVFKGHLASGQVREKEGGMAVWDRHESGGVLKLLWASHTWS